MATPYSIKNPPSAPKKEKRQRECEIPLEWRDHARRNLVREIEEEERRAHLREVEEVMARRRERQLKEREEKEERFLWLRPNFIVKPLDGPFYFDGDDTPFYL